MKNVPILIAFFLFICSCKKSDTQSTHSYSAFAGRPRPYTGVVTALKNGSPWKGYVYAYVTPEVPPNLGKRFLLLLETYVPIEGDTFRRDIISFRLLKPMAYLINPVSQYLEGYIENKAADTSENVRLVTYDVDAIDDRLNLIESQDNFFQISSFNPGTSEFTGKFETIFISTSSATDTIRFRNGVFSGKMYDSFFPK